jgi:hypothetical protein
MTHLDEENESDEEKEELDNESKRLLISPNTNSNVIIIIN